MVCLHRGVQLKPENFAEVKESDTLGSILRVMQKVGLRGRVLPRCKWKKLTALGYAYPVMAQQKAGHWVVVLSAVKGPDGPALTVLDPTVRGGAGDAGVARGVRRGLERRARFSASARSG